MTPKDQNVKLCKTRINNSPQAGLGEPTWPDKLSPSSIPLMTQEVSVMPYPSDTRQPKQLWSIIILFSQKKKTGKRTKNMYVLALYIPWKRKKLTSLESPWHRETRVRHLMSWNELVLRAFPLSYWKPICPTWEMHSFLKQSSIGTKRGIVTWECKRKKKLRIQAMGFLL